MAKKKRRRSQKMTIPLALAIGLGVPAINTVKLYTSGQHSVETASRLALLNWTGYNTVEGPGKMDFRQAYNLKSAIAGYLVHKGASMLGINRAIARTKIPLIRI